MSNPTTLPLVRLSNGDWVNPASVKALRKAKGETCSITGTVYQPRYIVDLKEGTSIIVECLTSAIVTECVDALAAAINGTADTPEP